MFTKKHKAPCDILGEQAQKLASDLLKGDQHIMAWETISSLPSFFWILRPLLLEDWHIVHIHLDLTHKTLCQQLLLWFWFQILMMLWSTDSIYDKLENKMSGDLLWYGNWQIIHKFKLSRNHSHLAHIQQTLFNYSRWYGNGNGNFKSSGNESIWSLTLPFFCIPIIKSSTEDK